MLFVVVKKGGFLMPSTISRGNLARSLFSGRGSKWSGGVTLAGGGGDLGLFSFSGVCERYVDIFWMLGASFATAPSR